MKRLAAGLLLLSLPALAGAQENETLLGGDLRSGGFGGPVVKFTEIHGELGVLVGGRGGWIVNNTFVIGGGGYGLANQDIYVEDVDPRGRTLNIQMGYGGLELEYVGLSREVVHFSLQTLVGAGGVTYHRWDDRYHLEDDAFFVAEPGVNVMLNVTEFFRVGFGASYRFVDGVDLPGLTDRDLDGPTGLVTLKFGSF